MFHSKYLPFLAVLSCGLSFASGKSHWSYEGAEGPANWAQLDKHFAACNGANQSPIDLNGFVEAELSPLQFNYAQKGIEVLNNGHTIQVNEGKGSSMNAEGVQYNLLQFHFHAPSENWLKGESYPLEVHLVHGDAEGHLAVIALLFKEGEENPFLKNFWSKMPHEAGEKASLTEMKSTLELLPKNKDYYRFNGSLTTPPCSEGVKWFVMKETSTASKTQIDAFKKIMHHENNRPLQKANARLILQ